MSDAAIPIDVGRRSALIAFFMRIVEINMPVKVNSKLKKFAKDNGHRIVAFTVETPNGSTTIEFEGCVTVEDSEKVAKMMQRIIEMTDKVEEAEFA